MKLYIPTCTLNFNNIFSTESISPANHYIRRGFGNKRYYKVEANDLDNVILLYSKYPNYHVDNEETENSTLVIEIESEDYPKGKYTKVNEINDVEIYASSSTIYFNPFHCSIYFDSVQDKTSVMTKADQSLENKYSKLYQGNFKIKDRIQTEDSFVWDKSFINNVNNVESSEVNNDILVDRIKGCFVCYLLGANMSVSKEISQLKQLARKMKNTLSAIFNSPTKRPTESQDKTLLSYIKEFNKIYSDADEISIYNENVISKHLVSPSTGLDKETIKNVLNDLKLKDYFYKLHNLHPIYDANDLYNCFYSDPITLPDSYNNEINKLFEVVKRIEITKQKNKPKKNIKELLSVQDNKIKVVDKDAGKGEFLSSLLNSMIAGEYKEFMGKNETGELLSIAYVGGAELKKFAPGEWENSEYKNYINSLLANIQNGERFDIFSNTSETMQSFAAFCQKGEDIDRLTDYMLQCGFSEYRYALGIYGATRGFAALPKTFTNALINESRDYYIDFFNYLHKELFGFDLKNAVIPDIKKSSIVGEISDKSIVSKSKKTSKTKSKRAESVKKQEGLNLTQPPLITESEFPVGQYFYNDRNVWDHIAPLIPEKDKKKILKDLNWFQDVFSKPKGGRGYTYDSVDESDNLIVIEKFCNLKLEKALYFTSDLREKIKHKLKELYHVN